MPTQKLKFGRIEAIGHREIKKALDEFLEALDLDRARSGISPIWTKNGIKAGGKIWNARVDNQGSATIQVGNKPTRGVNLQLQIGHSTYAAVLLAPSANVDDCRKAFLESYEEKAIYSCW